LDKILKIFPTPQLLAEAFAVELITQIKEVTKKGDNYTLSLSGGNTPKILFSVLAEKYSESVDWNFVHFFWGDERCVPSDNPESNYGTAYKILLEKINISDSNIHRITGDADPEKEAARYSQEIFNFTRSYNNLPLFDHIILGMGDDGHTASIFPRNIELLYSKKICDVAIHPSTGQKRITITGGVINNADNITFLVSGQSKAVVIENIFNKNPLAENYPAAHVVPDHGTITWFIDEKAGSSL